MRLITNTFVLPYLSLIDGFKLYGRSFVYRMSYNEQNTAKGFASRLEQSANLLQKQPSILFTTVPRFVAKEVGDNVIITLPIMAVTIKKSKCLFLDPDVVVEDAIVTFLKGYFHFIYDIEIHQERPQYPSFSTIFAVSGVGLYGSEVFIRSTGRGVKRLCEVLDSSLLCTRNTLLKVTQKDISNEIEYLSIGGDINNHNFTSLITFLKAYEKTVILTDNFDLITSVHHLIDSAPNNVPEYTVWLNNQLHFNFKR